MADKTKISWATSTWDPITGCSPLSEGCENCYAERIARRFPEVYGGTDDPFGVTYHPERLTQPWNWKKPRRIFVCSMGDLFHEAVEQAWIDDVFDVMSKCPQHVFMVLTKRPARMKAMLADLGKRWKSNALGPEIGPAWPLENVWLGVTAENQWRAGERIPILLGTPAAKRFVSLEPLLGLIDLRYLRYDSVVETDALHGTHGVWRPHEGQNPRLDWIICGGETGPKARHCHPDWVRTLRDQCVEADVPFHFKSWGALVLSTAGETKRLLDGRVWDEVPKAGMSHVP